MRVFPTSRNVRNYYEKHLNTNQFIPKAITLGEFFKHIVIVPERQFIDEESRLILLEQASDFKNFEKLHIQRDLLSFMHNSQYIFRFFEELASEGVAIEELNAVDTYAEYEEHLEALAHLRKRYKALLDHNGLIDTFFLREHYQLNHTYIEQLKSVEVILEGYFTNWEITLLLAVSESIDLTILFFANAFNKKMQNKFEAYGFVYEGEGSYAIDLKNRTSVKREMSGTQVEITATGFSERLLQVAFVKKAIYDMIMQESIAPEELVVVIPDESFSELLALYDTENYFNFAMGHPFKNLLFYRRIQALVRYFEHPKVEQAYRVEKLLEGLESVKEVWRLHYSEIVSMELFAKLIGAFSVAASSEEQKIIERELFTFSKLASMLTGLSFKVMLQLFMKRLGTQKLDDTRGGKITVMGLLETRAMAYKGVIVVDFNESRVPKKSDKDLFLSTQVKYLADLPTSKDREALQKYFYSQLFSQAKRVAISYVKNDTERPTKFLSQLGIKEHQARNENDYGELLYQKHPLFATNEKEIIADYSFKSRPLSATGLKSFLSCRRQYYYRYVQKLKGFEMPQDIPKEHEIGTWLHDILKELYQEQPRFSDLKSLKAAIEKRLAFHKQKGEMGRYLVRLWLERLAPFYAQEIARFEQGYEVYACEKAVKLERYGIELFGKIDRIDRSDTGGLEVLDYKSGSFNVASTAAQVEKTSDFQLQFYYLLAGTLGRVEQVGFYDLKKGTIAQETLNALKLERLDEILHYLSETTHFSFDKCEDKALCRFCDYQLICGRN